MSTFFSAFALGYEREPAGGSAAVPTFRQTKLIESISADDKAIFSTLLANFAKDHLDLTVVPRHDMRAQALALTMAKPKSGEAIAWDKPLFDSDGWPHTLVALGGIEVVTKQSFNYCTWNRKTGACTREGCADLVLGNTPMSDEERSKRKALATQAWVEMVASQTFGTEWDQQPDDMKWVLGLVHSFQMDPAVAVECRSVTELQVELMNPPQMSKATYLGLQNIVEGMELDVAKGQEFTLDFDKRMTLARQLMDAAPWTLHPDHGCVLRTEVDDLDAPTVSAPSIPS